MTDKDDLADAWDTGVKLGPKAKTRFTCEKTGAHFEFKDMSLRIERLR